MKLTVLGGSAAGGNTGAGCSGYLLQTATTTVVLDLGPGTLLELRKYCDYRQLAGIVVSHMHVDHILDLIALRFLLAYNPVPAEKRISLHLPPNGFRKLDVIGQAFASSTEEESFFDSVFDISEYDPDDDLAIGAIDLAFCPVQHIIPTWGMRLEDRAGQSLGYTADTGPCQQLQPFFTGVNTLISEATWTGVGDPSPDRIHLTAQEAGALATATGAKKLILAHTWEELGFDNYHHDAQTQFSGETLLARPGLQIEIQRGTNK